MDNIESMNARELDRFAEKVSMSLLEQSEKIKLFQQIDNRMTILRSRIPAECSEIAYGEVEDYFESRED